METISDILTFLNQMELFKIVSDIEYSTFKIIRKILIDEFNKIDEDKLIKLLKNLDDLYIGYLKMNINFNKTLLNSLRDCIFEIYEQKMISK